MSEAIFESAPIEVRLGPFTADDAAVWITDFAVLARYDVVSETWSEIDLPVQRDNVSSLSFLANGNGTAAVLLGDCGDVCDEEPPATFRAYHATRDGLTEVPGIDLTTDGAAAAITSNDTGAHFHVLDGNGHTQLVTVTADRATVTDAGRDLLPVCVLDEGHVMAVEIVNEAGRKTVTVLGGPSVDSLKPLEVPPAEAEALMGVELTSSAVCAGDVLALVGADRAWEFAASGEVAEVPAKAPVPFGRGQHQVAPEATHEGVTWVAASAVNLRRDDNGWGLAEDGAGEMTAARVHGYASVRGVLLTYPPGDEPAGVPDLSGGGEG